MNKISQFVDIGFKVGLVVVLGLFLQSQGFSLGAQSNWSGPINSGAGFMESGTEIINTNGAFTGVVSSTSAGRVGSLAVGGGTVLTDIRCAATSWDPPAITSSSPSSTNITATGIALTDVVFGTISTSTQLLGSFVTVSSTADVAYFGLFLPDGNSADSINLGNASVTVCWVTPTL